MLHACHAPSAAGAHASVVLQQAFLTQAVYEQQYLTAQEVPMLQFGTSQEYMYEDQAPMDMHGFELPTDAEGYVQQEGEEGMWADSECLRQHPGKQQPFGKLLIVEMLRRVMLCNCSEMCLESCDCSTTQLPTCLPDAALVALSSQPKAADKPPRNASLRCQASAPKPSVTRSSLGVN